MAPIRYSKRLLSQNIGSTLSPPLCGGMTSALVLDDCHRSSAVSGAVAVNS